MNRSIELLTGIIIGMIIGCVTMAVAFTVVEMQEGFTPLQMEQLEEVWD